MDSTDQDRDGAVSVGSLAEASFTSVGEESSEYVGEGVSAAGDVDGDGLHDLLVGAYRADDGGSDAGAAYLLPGG